MQKPAHRMHLLYGFNEIDAWWHLSLGDHRERIRKHLRLMDTQVMRIFVFDKPVPDPVAQWHLFAAYVQGVLDAGAVPMLTFAKFHPSYDDPRSIRTFVARCVEIVWGCIEQWGGEAVSRWYFCVWNEPNNFLIGGGLTFAQYRRIYEEVAAAVLELLEPHLGGNKARIGGPAVDGTQQPYWMDWIARFVGEIDDALVGFASWHRYGDWRPAVPSASIEADMFGAPEAPLGAGYEALLIAQTPEYEARARGVARLIGGRDILNVCGEVNAIAHHDRRYTRGLNQTAFGAAYYASALIHLIRGGADLEMRWTATEDDDAYGLMSREGEPSPACLAKQLFTRHVRFGDWIDLPARRGDAVDVDAIVAFSDSGRRSGVFVNTSSQPLVISVSSYDGELSGSRRVLKVDEGTGQRVVEEPFDTTVRLDGYGVAVVTNAAETTGDD